MATFNLDRFQTVIRDKSLARTNRFEVYINVPSGLKTSDAVSSSGDLISLYVESASLPLLNLAVKPFKIFGPTYQRPITSEYGGEGISFTFHVDRDMVVRKFFEDWMHTIVDPDTFTVGYQQDYATTINIRQLDEEENVTHEIELREAFPRSMNLMELNNASSNQSHRLNIVFAYRYWVNVDRGASIVPLPRPIQYPQVPRNESVLNNETRLKNVLPTGQYNPGTTNEDMAFGVNGLSG